MTGGRRRWLWIGFFWLAVSFVVWNGFFDVLVSRGEKQYFLSQARHELGLAPPAGLHQIMSRTIGDAVRVASTFGLIVFAAGMGATWIAGRSRTS